MSQQIKQRLAYLRGELRAERISWGELVELQGLTANIEPGDVELFEAAKETPNMPTMSQHTPTYTLDAGRTIVKDGVPLACISGLGIYDPCEVDELARTAVRAVNAHEVLVEALRNALSILEISCVCEEGKPINGSEYCDAWPAKQQVRAALAKAEGR